MPFFVVKMTKIKKFNFGIDKNVGGRGTIYA